MLEHVNGIWACMPGHVERLAAEGAFARRAAWTADQFAGTYLVDRGVAIVELSGVLTKEGSWFGTSSRDARSQVLAAAKDPEVHAIVVKIDSPGGSSAGVPELAEAIATADLTKPCYAFVEDIGASGAYWPASQARKVFANRNAAVGSIGAYTVVSDLSGMAEKEGVKIHVVKSGEMKGAGVPGTEVTDEQLAEVQKLIDDVHDLFVRAVAGGRKLSLSKTRELADGRVHTAPEAKNLGLIDEIRSFDSLVESLAAKKPKPPKTQGARAMSEQTEVIVETISAPRAAALSELKAELPGADAGFLLGQLEANATLAQASKAFIAELNQRHKAAEEARNAAEAKVAELETKKPAVAARPGVDPLPSAAADGDAPADAIAAWEQLVEAELKLQGKSAKEPVKLGSVTPRMRAQLSAAKKHPEAHAAYLTAYNAARRKQFGVRHAMRLSPAAMVASEVS